MIKDKSTRKGSLFSRGIQVCIIVLIEFYILVLRKRQKLFLGHPKVTWSSSISTRKSAFSENML